jgi:hypothetical protein
LPWTLTVRSGSKVTRERFDDLDAALDALEDHGRVLEKTASRDAVDVKLKTFDPVQQVSARIELAGPERLIPKVRAGVDIRGDGSTEAYLGRVRRQLVKQRASESSYKALRRALKKR